MALMYCFPNFEPFHCSMPSSNCCFLTYIHISQEEGKVIWYSHLFQHFPQFVVIHTVKGFGIVNKAEIDATGTLKGNRGLLQMRKLESRKDEIHPVKNC